MINWLSQIEKSHPIEIELGLDRIKEVGEKADLFTSKCPVITIAGTNGKGSTVEALSTLLQDAGLNIGAYTSPHLLSFNERIRINGATQSDEALCAVFEKIEALRGTVSLTFFEFTTLAALMLFKERDLDAIILEVGLGGRLDAVNAIAPDLAIVTAVHYDHEAYLGHTLEAIAKEKAGILRKNIPVVLSKESRISTLLNKASELNNQIFSEEIDFGYTDGSLKEWQIGGEVIKLPIFNLPSSSVSMALAAYTILDKLHFNLPDIQKTVRSLEQIKLLGRFFPLKFGKITVIFDVAHNPHASEFLAEKLKTIKGKGRIIAVWASLSDKALQGIVSPLKELIDVWCVGNLPGVSRAAPVIALTQALIAENVKDHREFPSIKEAFDGSLSMAKEGDHVVVFGSFHTVAEVFTNKDGNHG